MLEECHSFPKLSMECTVHLTQALALCICHDTNGTRYLRGPAWYVLVPFAQRWIRAFKGEHRGCFLRLGPWLCSQSRFNSQKASFTRTDTHRPRFMINLTTVCSCSCNKNGPFVEPNGLKQGNSIFRQFFWLLGKKFKFSPKLKDDSSFMFGLSENFLWKQHVWESTHVQEKVITGDEEVKKEHIQEFLMHLHFCS